MNEIMHVGYENDTLKDKARHLADTLNLAVDKDSASCLWVGTEGLALKSFGFSLLRADFSSLTWNKRKSEGKKQGLVRACKPNPGLKVIDVTAGWGRDAAILASFGAEVLMIERHPVMATLLEDALAQRTEADTQHMQLSLHHGDARSYLNALTVEEYPDIIYIDPMHPQRTKSALVKKEMQALQQMIGADEDALELILCAIKHVKQRVIVKWPQRITPLLDSVSCIEGKTVRFDIYCARS